MYYMKCYVQTTILIPTQQTPWAKWRERPKLKPSETKTKSQKPSAKWSQVKPSEAKWSQVKPKAKWARKWEILAPKCMQNTDFSSKMPQIARKAAPGCKTKKNKSKKYIPSIMKPPLLSGTKPLPPLALFHPCVWGTASRSASLRSSWREAVAKSHELWPELWPEVRPFQWGRYGKESTWTYCFWLVVSTYASEKWWSEFVSWDDEIMIIPFPII